VFEIPMTPRPYQLEAVERTESAFREFDKVLGVLPTGGGKTCVFSWLASRRAVKGQRTLILAHRDELIDQAITKLHAATGIRAAKEKAEFIASQEATVVVASIQTMQRRLALWPADHFGLIVCDEAHHVLSNSWQSVLAHFKGQVLGVTATPDRGDKKNLGSYFQAVAFEVGLFDLIDQGHLSRVTLKSIPLQIDLSKVKSVGGDLDIVDLGTALEPYLDQIAECIRDNAQFRRTLAFLPLIATSQKFVKACRNVGLSAEHIDGESPDRRQKLQSFANWDFDVLSNAMLLTEGFDDPGIDCVIVLRPTRSRPLYAQMVGRGTRILEGKQNLLLLDFLWMHERHNIIRPAHLIAKSEEEAQQITEFAHAAAMPADLAEQMPLDLQALAGDALKKREEALRKKLEAQKNKKAKTVSAEEFAMEHGSMEAAEYVETMAWESRPATEKQLKYLSRAKIDTATVRGKGHASRLLSLFFGAKPLTLASQAQRAKMRQLGHPNAEHATDDEARRFFADLRKPKQEALAI
jgi:superfamily II DNA or RNA helicase